MLVKKDSCNKDYWTSEIILGIILYFLFTGEQQKKNSFFIKRDLNSELINKKRKEVKI